MFFFWETLYSPRYFRKFLLTICLCIPQYEDVLANFMTENGAGNSSKMLTDDELEKGLIGDYKYGFQPEQSFPCSNFLSSMACLATCRTTALARAEKEGKKNPERVGGDEEAEKDRQR